MSIRNLSKILDPKRVAVIGASNKAGGVGYTVLRNMIAGGFAGVVYPVNPKSEAVQGIQAYPDVESLPHPADLAVICTPAATVPGIIEQCGKMGIMGIAILSAGFREVGKEGLKLENQIKRIQKRHDGMRIVGPNSLGVIVPRIGLNASFAATMPRPGHLAFISQSGALFTFQHPEADPQLDDVTGSYEWSLDLVTWNPSDATVTISAPEALTALSMVSTFENLPVPTSSRDVNSRSPSFSLSLIP